MNIPYQYFLSEDPGQAGLPAPGVSQPEWCPLDPGVQLPVHCHVHTGPLCQ